MKRTLTYLFYKPPKVTNNGTSDSDHVVNVDQPSERVYTLKRVDKRPPMALSLLWKWLKALHSL